MAIVRRGMHTEEARVSLADLSSAGVRLRPSEAVTLVREVVRQVSEGEVPGVPSAHVIRLTPAGALTIEGPVAADDRAVTRAAQLLEAILPPFDATGDQKVPGALRLVLARALGTLDVPSYRNLGSFDEALHRFSQPDPAAVIRQVLDRCAAASRPSSDAPSEHERPAPPSRVEPQVDRPAHGSALARREPATLTISDIRRARRASGLSLAEIAERSRVPVPLLRQLEWGYFENWPSGLYGRTQLVRYARAAGLDEQIVVAAVWPYLEQREAEAEVVEAAEVTSVPVLPVPVSVGDIVLDTGSPVHLAEVESAPPAAPRRRKAGAAAALLAAAAMVTFLVLPRVEDIGLPALPRMGSTPPVQNPVQSEEPAPATADAAISQPAAAEPTGTAGPPAGDSPSGDATVASAAAARESEPAAEPASHSAEPVRGLAGAETSWSPAFASVGSAMFYHAEAGRDGPSDVVRAETDGEGTVLRITRVVDDHARNFHARPSPDGSRIAFDSDRDGERGVYIADADGSNVRRVSGEGFAAVPSWSPDGETLAFVRGEPGRPHVWNLWLLHLPTNEFRRLTSYRYGQLWGGSWFPDGRRIAYSHEDRLLVLEIASGRDRVFDSPRKGRLVRTPAVSPDGGRIIFQVHRDGAWLLDLSDESMRKVLADPTAEEYAWSPDGRRVAYHSRRSGQWGVWLMASR